MPFQSSCARFGFGGGNVRITSLSLAKSGSFDTYIAKYNTSGDLQWAARIGGTGDDQSYSISTDTSGNVYVTGYYASNPVTIFNANGTSFGTLASVSSSIDVFIVKYNTSGVVQWTARIADIGDDRGYGISTDGSNNVYVTGFYTSNPVTIFNANGTSFGTLANAGLTDAFIVKYNTSGVVQWTARIGGTGDDPGYAITSDTSGNVYVTGYYASNPVTIFNANGTSFGTLANAGSADTFIVRYNTSGVVQWTARIAGTGAETGWGITTDTSGNVYLTGQYSTNPVTIFNANGTSFGTLANAGTSDACIVKYNTSGVVQWTARITGSNSDIGFDIASDSSGNVYVAGRYLSTPITIFNANGTSFGTLANAGSVGTADVFLVKYNTSGVVQWTARIGGTSDERPYGIGVDSSGNVYVFGNYESTTLTIFNANGTTFGTLTTPLNRRAFTVKYNTSGTAQWAARIGNTNAGGTAGSDNSQGGACDAAGNAYITGPYASNPLMLYSQGI